ncbi:hypothetical protein A2572_04615 [Candidatus Collierbacteria bacterium RIFOXYD1_FULL_40_9]|uniref:peptidylprolyl isomerase n=1 Tax=Candidatus Collierbacteria bacterium RIFOXYD1_FULL_40_9 TaxID=1817731 RepID=A0A1F5FUQ9_9BACT|nr:MAG: hypothetical protein A2572_04615 [Candidatus Collierbacteria bacterium RIFOXYD1_FULL_40_9]
MKTKKNIKSSKAVSPIEENSSPTSNYQGKNLTFSYKLILVIVLGVLSYMLATKYRNLIVVGTVNNMPVSRYELNRVMAEKYGKQTFEDLVNERLLAQEIKKQGIVITEEEVKVEVDKITKEYGSEENFKAALEQYGLTLEKAKESIRKNLGFKKLVEKTSKIEITDEAVKKYFDDNKTIYAGKKLDEVKDSIKDSLYQQELYQKSQELFTGVRQSAKVSSFL